MFAARALCHLLPILLPNCSGSQLLFVFSSETLDYEDYSGNSAIIVTHSELCGAGEVIIFPILKGFIRFQSSCLSGG